MTNDSPEIIRQRIAYVTVISTVSVGLVYALFNHRGVLDYEARRHPITRVFAPHALISPSSRPHPVLTRAFFPPLPAPSAPALT